MTIAALALVARLAPTAKHVAAYLDTLQRAPESRQLAILGAIRVTTRALEHVIAKETEYALRDATAHFPTLDRNDRARIVLGESLATISGLDRRDAHAWATTSPTSWAGRYVEPAMWLLRDRGIPAECHDIRVARWIVDCWRDPPRRAALERVREERGPHGETISGSYLSRVDELRGQDLRPSVETTFARCATRLTKALERSMRSRGEPLRAAPRWWRPIRCARLLLSAADLAAEGRALQHCVAQYTDYVRKGESVIVGLCVLGHRSTAEIDPKTLVVRQHRGPKNEAPNELNKRALKVCLQRWT